MNFDAEYPGLQPAADTFIKRAIKNAYRTELYYQNKERILINHLGEQLPMTEEVLELEEEPYYSCDVNNKAFFLSQTSLYDILDRVLDKQEKLIIEGSYFWKLSDNDIAKRCNCSRTTVNRKRLSAKDKIISMEEDYGYEYNVHWLRKNLPFGRTFSKENEISLSAEGIWYLHPEVEILDPTDQDYGKIIRIEESLIKLFDNDEFFE